MTHEIRVEFQTTRRRDIPTIGQPRRVKVNGRFERKYVKSIVVKALRYYGEPLLYDGFYTLTDASGMWG